MSTPVDTIYNQRKDYIIVALTGITEIVYLDPYTDIAPELIRMLVYDQPKLKLFKRATGETFYKLYQPFMPYKDELALWEKRNNIWLNRA